MSSNVAAARWAVLPVCTLVSITWASGSLSPGLYEVTVETGLPHLEENLRYATTREEVCLAAGSLVAFPILSHPALEGCALEKETAESYALVCASERGTTGQAIWNIEDRRMRGTIRIKLGGKNMTLHQHVTARWLRACEGSAGIRQQEPEFRG
jgi:hypothetical protein